MSEHWRLHEAESGRWQIVRSGSAYNFGSREEAEAWLAEWRANGTCRECGDVLNDGYMEPYKARIIEQQLCFGCLFWVEVLAGCEKPTHVHVDGMHYMICDEHESGGFRGFGGSRFDIRFHDGRTATTTNLWHQGTVPEHFRDRITDNAEFVREAAPATPQPQGAKE